MTEARANAVAAGAQGPAAQAQAENALTGALRSLFAVVENYPELKANQNVLSLQEQLTTTENQISFSRQHYNADRARLQPGHRDLPERADRRPARLHASASSSRPSPRRPRCRSSPSASDRLVGPGRPGPTGVTRGHAPSIARSRRTAAIRSCSCSC